MINNAITSTVYMPFNLPAPNALTRALLVKDGNGVLPILHGLPDVEQQVFEAGRLVEALAGREIWAVVLESVDGGHGLMISHLKVLGEYIPSQPQKPGRQTKCTEPL